MQKHVTLLTPTLSQPRYHRRAEALLKIGCQVRAFSFSRGYYEQNKFPEPVSVETLGTIKNGSSARRIPSILRASLKVRRLLKGRAQPSLTIAFGLDMLAIALLSSAKGTNIVYEVGDINTPFTSRNLKDLSIRHLEKRMLSRCSGLILTSPAYFSDYFSILSPRFGGTVAVIENKLSLNVAERFERPQGKRALGAKIRIGCIGFFKYPNCLNAAVSLASRHPDKIELHAYGDGPLASLFTTAGKTHRNIFYHGSFSYSSDLPAIYNSIDLNYIAYDATDENVRLALPNKLYESVYFGVPIIASEGTYLAKLAGDWKVGVFVQSGSDNSLELAVLGLNQDSYDALCGNTRTLPVQRLVANPETDLKELLHLL